MATHIHVFEPWVAEAQEWLDEIMRRVGFADPHYALRGLGAVLHALRDELSVNQNVALAAQMPTVVRGVFFQDWKPQLSEPKHKSKDEFLSCIDEAFRRYQTPPDPKKLAEEVFGILQDRIAGECSKIRRTLPEDLRGLWPGGQ